MRLAVLANEFFDPALGPMGGFGWATREVAEGFTERPDLGVDVVMFCGRHLPPGMKTQGDIPVVGRPGRKPADIKNLLSLDPDLILTIDYRVTGGCSGCFRVRRSSCGRATRARLTTALG